MVMKISLTKGIEKYYDVLIEEEEFGSSDEEEDEGEDSDEKAN